MNIIDLLISTIQFFPQWGGQVAIGTALSLFVTEVVRDGYHSLHHIVPFLYHRFHRWHHEPYGDGFEDKDHEAFRRGLRRFDIPESCAMAIANLGLLKVCVAA